MLSTMLLLYLNCEIIFAYIDKEDLLMQLLGGYLQPFYSQDLSLLHDIPYKIFSSFR